MKNANWALCFSPSTVSTIPVALFVLLMPLQSVRLQQCFADFQTRISNCLLGVFTELG